MYYNKLNYFTCRNRGKNCFCSICRNGPCLGIWALCSTAHMFGIAFLRTLWLCPKWRQCKKSYVVFVKLLRTAAKWVAWKLSPSSHPKPSLCTTFSPSKCCRTKLSASSPTTFDCVIHVNPRVSVDYYFCCHHCVPFVNPLLKHCSSKRPSGVFPSQDCSGTCISWKNVRSKTKNNFVQNARSCSTFNCMDKCNYFFNICSVNKIPVCGCVYYVLFYANVHYITGRYEYFFLDLLADVVL